MPRRLGTLACLLVLAVALVATLAPEASARIAGPGPTAARTERSLESGLLRLINGARAEHGLPALRPSAMLAQAAIGHARAMARFGFFAHSSRDGSSPRDRVTRIAPQLASRGVGEVLLWRSPGPSPDQALSMWLSSPPHRAVLLSSGLSRIGLVALDAHAAPGVFGGLDVTIVAADLSG